MCIQTADMDSIEINIDECVHLAIMFQNTTTNLQTNKQICTYNRHLSHPMKYLSILFFQLKYILNLQ